MGGVSYYIDIRFCYVENGRQPRASPNFSPVHESSPVQSPGFTLTHPNILVVP